MRHSSHMKKRLFYCALLTLLLSLVVNGTLAYFTDKARARNVITFGTVDVEVVEYTRDEDGDLVEYPTEPVGVMPGASISKIVTVQAAEEAEEAYVRMKVEITILKEDGSVMPHTREQLEKVVFVHYNTADWSYRDGWWYYDQAISDAESTDPLFERVSFSGPNMGNEYQNCTIEIDVKAQAVQADNNGDSALEAAGWPAE